MPRLLLVLCSGLLLSGCANLIQAASRDMGGTPKPKTVTATGQAFSSTEPAAGAAAPTPQLEFQAGQPIYSLLTVNETLRDIPRQDVFIALYWTSNPALTDPQKLQALVQSKEDGNNVTWEEVQPGGAWRTKFKVPEAQLAQKTLVYPLLPPELALEDKARLELLNRLAQSAASPAKYTVLVQYFWDGGNEKRYVTYGHFLLDTTQGSYDAMALAVGSKVVLPSPKKLDPALEKEIVQAATLKWGPSEKKAYFKTILDAEDWSRVTSGTDGSLVGRTIDVWVLARSKDKKACYAEQMRASQQHMSGGVFGQATVDDREKVYRLDCTRFKGL